MTISLPRASNRRSPSENLGKLSLAADQYPQLDLCPFLRRQIRVEPQDVLIMIELRAESHSIALQRLGTNPYHVSLVSQEDWRHSSPFFPYAPPPTYFSPGRRPP